MNIKKRVFSLLSSCYVVGCLFAQNILISTPATSLVLSAPEKGEPEIHILWRQAV